MSNKLDFVVTGLGRCRTAWFSALFNTDAVACAHEASREVKELTDYQRFVVPGCISGISDTCAWALGADLQEVAERVLVIHRDPAEINASFKELLDVEVDVRPHEPALKALAGLHVDYRSLGEPEIIRQIWEYCTGTPCDMRRVKEFLALDIQILDPWMDVADDNLIIRRLSEWR